jgi:hypothetical protein
MSCITDCFKNIHLQESHRTLSVGVETTSARVSLAMVGPSSEHNGYPATHGARSLPGSLFIHCNLGDLPLHSQYR